MHEGTMKTAGQHLIPHCCKSNQWFPELLYMPYRHFIYMLYSDLVILQLYSKHMLTFHIGPFLFVVFQIEWFTVLYNLTPYITFIKYIFHIFLFVPSFCIAIILFTLHSTQLFIITPNFKKPQASDRKKYAEWDHH